MYSAIYDGSFTHGSQSFVTSCVMEQASDNLYLVTCTTDDSYAAYFSTNYSSLGEGEGIAFTIKLRATSKLLGGTQNVTITSASHAVMQLIRNTTRDIYVLPA